jgi:hypothetical protein
MLASSGWGAATILLPFVLLFAFWFFLTRRVGGRVPPGQEQMIQKLDEIREEIRRLRQAVEQDDYARH